MHLSLIFQFRKIFQLVFIHELIIQNQAWFSHSVVREGEPVRRWITSATHPQPTVLWIWANSTNLKNLKQWKILQVVAIHSIRFDNQPLNESQIIFSSLTKVFWWWQLLTFVFASDCHLILSPLTFFVQACQYFCLTF